MSLKEFVRDMGVRDAAVFGYEHYPIVCICGSMKFEHRIRELAAELTLDGKFVLAPFAVKVGLTPTQERMLDQMHRRKIAMARGGIYIVTNPQNYLGKSTALEIRFAESIGRPITYDQGGQVL